MMPCMDNRANRMLYSIAAYATVSAANTVCLSKALIKVKVRPQAAHQMVSIFVSVAMGMGC